MKRVQQLSILLLILVVCVTAQVLCLSTSLAADDTNRHVVVICVDGLPAYLFDDPNAPLPTIRELARDGVVADGMTVSNPSVTWPNHTSMTTGVRPERHGVLFNGKLERTGLGLPVKVVGAQDQADLVHAPTIWDVLHEHKLTTAAINWPCTRNSSIDDNFPDVPDSLQHTTPRLIAEMKQAGIMSDADIRGFTKLSGPLRDRIWTRAVSHVILSRKPNLVLFHLLNVDSTHHKYGPQSPASYTAVAFADTCVREVVAAIDAAGIRDRTTVFVVADHGFMSIPQLLQPNVVLRQSGLLTVEGDKIVAARAQVIPEGGTAMLYLTVPDSLEEDRKKVIDLFRNRPEIADILTPADFAKYGLPNPKDYPQMADLILVAKDGYGFTATATGEDFVIKSDPGVGTHGFLSTHPKMNATFVASGNRIRRGQRIGPMENIDIAPTIARLLNVPLPSVDGKVLDNVISDQSAK